MTAKGNKSNDKSNDRSSKSSERVVKSLLPDRWFQDLSERLGAPAALVLTNIDWLKLKNFKISFFFFAKVAPELHARSPVEFSDRADIWSAGLILHEVCHLKYF